MNGSVEIGRRRQRKRNRVKSIEKRVVSIHCISLSISLSPPPQAQLSILFFFFFLGSYCVPFCIAGDLMFQVYPEYKTIICAKIKESKIFAKHLHDANTNVSNVVADFKMILDNNLVY